jgi:hypothetical protein
VRLKWNFLLLALLAALSLAVAGCGGINASKTVSPLDFFLPGAGGFLKAAPPAVDCTNLVASLR